jgi:hypothetical protein
MPRKGTTTRPTELVFFVIRGELLFGDVQEKYSSGNNTSKIKSLGMASIVVFRSDWFSVYFVCFDLLFMADFFSLTPLSEVAFTLVHESSETQPTRRACLPAGADACLPASPRLPAVAMTSALRIGRINEVSTRLPTARCARAT